MKTNIPELLVDHIDLSFWPFDYIIYKYVYCVNTLYIV